MHIYIYICSHNTSQKLCQITHMGRTNGHNIPAHNIWQNIWCVCGGEGVYMMNFIIVKIATLENSSDLRQIKIQHLFVCC